MELTTRPDRDRDGVPDGEAVFERSGDKKWWYRSASNIVSNYARHNPYEDFAESFTAYFCDLTGRKCFRGPDDLDGDGKNDLITGAELIPVKISLIDAQMRDLSD